MNELPAKLCQLDHRRVFCERVVQLNSFFRDGRNDLLLCFFLWVWFNHEISKGAAVLIFLPLKAKGAKVLWDLNKKRGLT